MIEVRKNNTPKNTLSDSPTRRLLTELQLAKVPTADLLAHTEIRSHHEHAGGARGARRSRRVSAAASLGGFSRPGGPLAVLVPLLIHGVEQHRSAGARGM